MTEPADITWFGDDEHDEMAAELEQGRNVVPALRGEACAPRRFVRVSGEG